MPRVVRARGRSPRVVWARGRPTRVVRQIFDEKRNFGREVPPSPGLDLATTCAFFSASSSHINELPHNGVKILENVLVRDAGSLQIAQYELVHSYQGPVRRHGRARGANSCLALSSRTQAKRDAESKRTAKAAVLRQTVETPPRTDCQNSSRPLSGLVV